MKEKQLIEYVLKENSAAINFVNAMAKISQVWDDLIDGDKPVKKETVSYVFWLALVEIPQNPFYNQYQYQLIPLFREYINCWHDANAMERSRDPAKIRVAYVLRDKFSGLLAQCAYLVGGYDWMRKASPMIRDFIYNEPFKKYQQEKSHG